MPPGMLPYVAGSTWRYFACVIHVGKLYIFRRLCGNVKGPECGRLAEPKGHERDPVRYRSDSATARTLGPPNPGTGNYADHAGVAIAVGDMTER